MTTINGVPRELLELAYQATHALAGMNIDGFTEERCMQLRALLAEQPQAGAGQAVPTICDDDSVLVPRGLIGAACYAIDKKADAPEVLKNLRSYRFVAAPQPAARQERGDEVRRLREALAGLVALYEDDEGCRSLPQYKAARSALTHSPKGEEE